MVSSKKDIKALISNNKELISSYGVRSIGLFGSFVRDQATPKSDVDILVEFQPGRKNYDNFINLAYYLENLFGRKVELVTPSSLSRYLKPKIEKTVEYVPLSVGVASAYQR